MEARTVATGTDWSADAFERETYAEVAASKPRNSWTTESLADAGFPGCDPVDWTARPATSSLVPTAHVVRLPAAEGYAWVRMSPAEVANRMAGFGGTASTADDVKLVGNCYGGLR